jgi:G protein-coupled receptor 107
LVTFAEATGPTNATHLQRHFALGDILEDYEGGEFILYFANCNPYTAVDFDVELALYNVKGKRQNYLPLGQDVLPLLYFASFAAFATAAGVWVTTVLRARHGAQRVHWVMAALVVLKALTTLSQAVMFHMIAVYGHPEGWNVAFYLFTAVRSVLFFAVIILIAAGWSYMRPFLGEREKQVLMIVIPLQVVANVAIVVTDELTPAAPTWVSWRDVWHVVDILCCCAVLFPIVWAIKQLRETAEEDGKTARALAKLVLFRQFYIMVVSLDNLTVVLSLRNQLPSYSG